MTPASGCKRRRSSASQTRELSGPDATRSSAPLLSRSVEKSRYEPGARIAFGARRFGELLRLPLAVAPRERGQRAIRPPARRRPAGHRALTSAIVSRLHVGDSSRALELRELPRLPVDQDVQLPGRIDEHRVRISVAIDVAPRETSRAAEAANVEPAPRAVTVVPQHHGRDRQASRRRGRDRRPSRYPPPMRRSSRRRTDRRTRDRAVASVNCP